MSVFTSKTPIKESVKINDKKTDKHWFVIEGNIGSGKSTMLQHLRREHPEYIYIDEDERKIISQMKHEMLIEKLQYQPYVFSYRDIKNNTISPKGIDDLNAKGK